MFYFFSGVSPCQAREKGRKLIILWIMKNKLGKKRNKELIGMVDHEKVIGLMDWMF